MGKVKEGPTQTEVCGGCTFHKVTVGACQVHSYCKKIGDKHIRSAEWGSLSPITPNWCPFLKGRPDEQE